MKAMSLDDFEFLIKDPAVSDEKLLDEFQETRCFDKEKKTMFLLTVHADWFRKDIIPLLQEHRPPVAEGFRVMGLVS